MKIRGMKEREITGLVWSGTNEQAANGDILNVIKEVKDIADDIDYKINPHELIGVSIHNRRDGFTHYIGWETETGYKTPQGMSKFILPEADYLIYRHMQTDDITETYTKIIHEIERRGLTPLKLEDTESFDDLPIKIELHHAGKILEGEPEFEVHVPVRK